MIRHMLVNFPFLETDESVKSSYLLINHQLKFVVNETKKYINRFNGFSISKMELFRWLKILIRN